jgi:multidrug resistance efflux pump
VELLEEVKQGDTVAEIDAVLDNEPLEAELATISAEIQHLMAQLVPTQEQLLAEEADRQTNWLDNGRRFAVDAEAAGLRVLEFRTILETDRITLEDLAVEVKIEESLLEKGAVSEPYNLEKARALHDSLAAKIRENEKLLEQARRELAETRKRQAEFAEHQPYSPSVDNALEVIRKAVAVQEKMLEGVLKRREPVVLKSPLDGVIIQVLGRPRDIALRRPGEVVIGREGEVVLAGEPILTIAETKPREIIAYAGLQQLGQVREGMAVQLVKTIEPAQIATSKVVHLGPTLERLPESLWQTPNIAQWGHPMLIEIPPNLKLKPGEMVGIRGL